MSIREAFRHTRSVLAFAGMVIALAAVVAPGGAQAGPCDIYAADGVPCVAAHSLTRALFADYAGPLYKVQRASDQATLDIGVVSPGGFADAAAQDSFCAKTTCVVTLIFDQTSRQNDLPIEGAGTNGPANRGVPADALPVTAGGRMVYGASFSGRTGYRHRAASGVAVNGQPEGMYMVTSGTHFNGGCCFDYGNVEVPIADTGNGHMDAVYFGSLCWFPPCNGRGPWVMADLENGLFQSNDGVDKDVSNTGNRNPYVTAMIKNDGQKFFAIKDGNAQTGRLTTRYSGALPTFRRGYSPMQQEGSIVLGTGGDNSNVAIGSFFEGAMTFGVPSDAAENAVQADIVSVGYGGPSPVAPGALKPGSTISLRSSTTRSVRHQNDSVVTSAVSASSPRLDKEDAAFIVRRGLASDGCLSFESLNFPGDFLRHRDFQLLRQPNDGSAQFRSDATFCPQGGLNGQGTSFASLNFPDRFIRQFDDKLFIASKGGPNPFDAPASFADDATWRVSMPFSVGFGGE